MNSSKLITFLILISTCLGFRLLNPTKTWNISEESPTLWLKPCSRDIVIKNNNITLSDPLYGIGELSNTAALESIAENINNIYGSYVNVELYPLDTSSPTSSSEFTIEKSEERTIEVCEGNPSAAASATAQWDTNGDTIVGCEIVYKESVKDNLISYIGTITHEIGHCLGLNHPQENVHSVMSYFSDGDKFFRLAFDDKIGIRHLYPETIDGVSHKEMPTFGMSCATKK